jgi:hypothetical protein
MILRVFWSTPGDSHTCSFQRHLNWFVLIHSCKYSFQRHLGDHPDGRRFRESPFFPSEERSHEDWNSQTENLRDSFGVGEGDVGSEADHAEAGGNALTAAERRAVL